MSRNPCKRVYPEQVSKDAYSRPRVTDHGSLVALTADFDANFVGSVAKVVLMAQVSMPLVTPGDDGSFVPSGDVIPDDGSGGTVPDTTPGGGGGGGGVPSVPGSDGGGASPGGGEGGGGTAPAGGGVAVAADQGGKLPFTGYAVLVVAGVGAAFTSTGVAVRAALRRRT